MTDPKRNGQQQTATGSTTQQHTATHSNPHKLTATHSNSQQLTATHSNSQQFTATHSNSQLHLWHTTDEIPLSYGSKAMLQHDGSRLQHRYSPTGSDETYLHKSMAHLRQIPDEWWGRGCAATRRIQTATQIQPQRVSTLHRFLRPYLSTERCTTRISSWLL